MADNERIVKGHECCKNGFCLFCPYEDGMEDTKSCKGHLADDTIAALLSGSPRLLGVEEVKELEPGSTFWLETWCIPEPGVDPVSSLEMAVVVPDKSIHLYSTWMFHGDFTLHNDANYKERAWSVKPTEEQRAAEPWPEAEAKPEPQYPTWIEFFLSFGLSERDGEGYRICVERLRTPMDPDIAKRLDIEPKEAI